MAEEQEGIDLVKQKRVRKRGQTMTEEEQLEAKDKVLKLFVEYANMTSAIREVGMSWSTLYYWQETDLEFSIRYKQAENEVNDKIRAEIFRRGVKGYQKPTVSMGKIVRDDKGEIVYEQVYSDMLLSLLAKARMPEFRDKSQVDVNQSVSDQKTDALRSRLALLTLEQLAQIERWIQDAESRIELKSAK